MKVVQKMSSAIVIGVFAVIGLAAVGTTENTYAEENKTETAVETFRYVAQPGDSYTQMARKAVQTYGITEKVTLSSAQIVYAETNLTTEARNPYLSAGQAVEIEKSSVKNWVEKAQKITGDAITAWEAYVPYINFRTNEVGE